MEYSDFPPFTLDGELLLDSIDDIINDTSIVESISQLISTRPVNMEVVTHRKAYLSHRLPAFGRLHIDTTDMYPIQRRAARRLKKVILSDESVLKLLKKYIKVSSAVTLNDLNWLKTDDEQWFTLSNEQMIEELADRYANYMAITHIDCIPCENSQSHSDSNLLHSDTNQSHHEHTTQTCELSLLQTDSTDTTSIEDGLLTTESSIITTESSPNDDDSEYDAEYQTLEDFISIPLRPNPNRMLADGPRNVHTSKDKCGLQCTEYKYVAYFMCPADPLLTRMCGYDDEVYYIRESERIDMFVYFGLLIFKRELNIHRMNIHRWSTTICAQTLFSDYLTIDAEADRFGIAVGPDAPRNTEISTHTRRMIEFVHNYWNIMHILNVRMDEIVYRVLSFYLDEHNIDPTDDQFDRLYDDYHDEIISRVLLDSIHLHQVKIADEWTVITEFNTNELGTCELCCDKPTNYICKGCRYPMCVDCLKKVLRGNGKCPCCRSDKDFTVIETILNKDVGTRKHRDINSEIFDIALPTLDGEYITDVAQLQQTSHEVEQGVDDTPLSDISMSVQGLDMQISAANASVPGSDTTVPTVIQVAPNIYIPIVPLPPSISPDEARRMEQNATNHVNQILDTMNMPHITGEENLAVSLSRLTPDVVYTILRNIYPHERILSEPDNSEPEERHLPNEHSLRETEDRNLTPPSSNLDIDEIMNTFEQLYHMYDIARSNDTHAAFISNFQNCSIIQLINPPHNSEDDGYDPNTFTGVYADETRRMFDM